MMQKLLSKSPVPRAAVPVARPPIATGSRRNLSVARIGPELVEVIPAAALEATVGVEAGLIAGGVVLAGLASGVAWAVQQGRPQRPMTPEQQEEAARAQSAPPPPPRENAVLVVGASGRVGRKVVQRLLAEGRTVVAAARSTEAAEKALVEESGLKLGYQNPEASSGGILFVESVDVRDTAALKRPELWKGVQQVLLVVAGRGGVQANGQFGFFDGLTPEDVEAKGVQNLVQVLSEVMPKQAEPQFATILPMGNAEEVAVWQRMDDVIMGGQSASVIEAAPDVGPMVARWKGELILEGGGFCGARTRKLDKADWSAYDGVALRVKGDGSIFKLNIKTVDQMDTPESTYQTTFDTVAGQWHDVFLPWHNFVPVKRATSDPDGVPLDPSKIATFGIVLSRFEFNKAPNPKYNAGAFELLIDGGVRAFKAVRSQVVHLSSAGVERNAIIGEDAERRKKDVPIVQLNPAGVLNHKYAAELAVRASGYPYTVVRGTGMVDKKPDDVPALLEADQGDRISGMLTRDDMAELLVQVLLNPESAYKTFEVRRSAGIEAQNKTMASSDYNRLFLKLAMDRHRWRVGLGPFPKYSPPPAAPVTQERREEIVKDIEVVRAKLGVKGDAPKQPEQPKEEEKKQEAEEKVPALAGARQ